MGKKEREERDEEEERDGVLGVRERKWREDVVETDIFAGKI